MTDSETLYCYIHPNRPTVLRCNRCERPICTEDARRTPTGYRCPNCIREQQKTFDTAQTRDYVVAFVVAAVLSAVASGLVMLISGFFFGLGVLLLAPAAGGVIGNVVLSRHGPAPLAGLVRHRVGGPHRRGAARHHPHQPSGADARPGRRLLRHHGPAAGGMAGGLPLPGGSGGLHTAVRHPHRTLEACSL